MKIENNILYRVSNDDIINGTVTIPDGITRISPFAFCDCIKFKSVTIPDSVTSIGEGAFSYCDSLTSINVAADNKYYSSQDGVLFNKDKTELICYPAGKTGAYTIPDSVTSIGGYAFCHCSSLTSVTIPNSMTSIGESAFYDCTRLTSVTIPDSVASIGSYAFYGCSNLTSITIPNSVTRIGYNAFCHCRSLTSVTISNSVTSIGVGAFCNCSSLISVTIPDSVTSIGNYAFENCSSIIAVTIPTGVMSIGDRAFYECHNLTSITIPDSITRIGNSAFYHCFKLSKHGNFKATDGDMCCRAFQYELGETYIEDNVQLCARGFHYCENAFDLFNYYYGEIGTDIRLFEVEPDNISEETRLEDSKRVCGKIKLLREVKAMGELLN